MHNHVTLIGNLGADPEIRKTGSDTQVMRCRVATSESFKKDGEWVSKTQWHQVTMFGAGGTYFGNNARKGQQVLIEGRIEYREHEGKWYTDIIAFKARILERKEREDAPARPQEAPPPDDDLDDEMPF